MSVRHGRRFRGVTLPTAAHPAIRAVRRRGGTPSIHGNKLWKSSCLLIDYLHRHPPGRAPRVMDVGCGWGIGGIWCARRLDASVLSVDADPAVFPYLDVVAALNGVQTAARVCRFERITGADLADIDLLIGADICFWDELVKPVANLVNRAIRAGVGEILIADPERATFLAMAERCIDRHGGELLDWRTRGSMEARGALLHLSNR